MSKSKATKPATTSNTLIYRRDHPGNWVSFGIDGVTGRAVFNRQLFANGKPPKSITVDCALAVPVAKVPKVAKVAKARKAAKVAAVVATV
jgi:hypothetical protein